MIIPFRPRVLVFEPKTLHVNPSEAVFLKTLEQFCDVVRYGPGHVPFEKLSRDARSVYDKLGPFDAVFLHQYLLYNTLSLAPGSAPESVFCRFNKSAFLRDFPRFPENVDKLPGPLFAILIRADPYQTSMERIEILERFPGFLIARDADLIVPLESLVDIDQEYFIDKANDNYTNFAKSNPARFIPTVHTLDAREFRRRRWWKKKYTIAIPGEGYVFREAAVRAAEARGYTPLRIARSQAIVGEMARRLGVNLVKNQWGIRYLNYAHRALIAKSKACFTDGSVLRYPARKFFEIPAVGSLLMCIPFAGMENMGFENGRDYIACRPEEVPDVLERVNDDPDGVQKIVRRGQELVWRTQSVAAREVQWRGILNRAIQGCFCGARWERGKLVDRAEGVPLDKSVDAIEAPKSKLS